MLSGASAVVLALALVVSPPSLSLSLALCPARRRCPFGRPDDSRHVRWPGVETDAHSECLPEEVVAAGGSAHVVTFARLGAINAPAVRDHFPRLLESGVPETVLLHILAPVPPAERRTGSTAGSGRRAGPTHHAQGVADGGSRGYGPVSERSHAGGPQLAGGVHETGHGVQSQDGGDVGGGRRVCPLPARRQQATHHRRRAPHRQLLLGGAVPRRGHLAPGEADAHPGLGGAAAGGQAPTQGGTARPPRIQAQAGVRPRRAGA